MKKKALFILSMATLLVFNACEEDTLKFTAKESEAGIAFTNSFASEYLITKETADNIAERFIWKPADFGVSVNVNYELQGSIDPTFGTFSVLGTNTETNIAVTVDQLLDFAEDLGLDDDPATTTETGSPNNTGEVFFRLRAYTGTGAANAVEELSAVQPLSIKWIERQATTMACPSYWVLGDAAVDAQWDWNTAVEFTCESDVHSVRMSLTGGNFRFFDTEGDWASGLGYNYFGDDGYTIDANLEAAGDGDDNFTFVGTPGIYEFTIDDNAKTITLTLSTPYYLVGDGTQAGWSWDTPVELVENSPYIRSGSVDLNTTGVFRVFTADGDWDSGQNYPYFEDAGYTIDANLVNAADGDSNFQFTGTPGTYTMTINQMEKTITLE